jgi:hypothetical protein
VKPSHQGGPPIKQLVLGAALVGIGTANAQVAQPRVQSGDALWHLTRFGEQGWFLHANDGLVRTRNTDKVSVVGECTAPSCAK